MEEQVLMEKICYILIPTGFLSIFISCNLFVFPELHVESCRFSNGTAAGGYAVEIQGIPDIKKLDIDRTVRSFSRRIETPKALSSYSSDDPSDYRYITIFYDLNTPTWFTPVRYSVDDKPSPAPKTIINFWDNGVKKFQVDPSQKSLRFWIDSNEDTCASPYEESIPDFKKRISFLSFRLYYNDRIYDAAPLLRYEKGNMFIGDKVKRVQPTPETKSNFYPPFFMKKPGYILSTDLHEVQFSDLRLVPPEEVVKK